MKFDHYISYAGPDMGPPHKIYQCRCGFPDLDLATAEEIQEHLIVASAPVLPAEPGLPELAQRNTSLAQMIDGISETVNRSIRSLRESFGPDQHQYHAPTPARFIAGQSLLPSDLGLPKWPQITGPFQDDGHAADAAGEERLRERAAEIKKLAKGLGSDMALFLAMFTETQGEIRQLLGRDAAGDAAHQLSRINELLQEYGFEYPLGARGVADALNMLRGYQSEEREQVEQAERRGIKEGWARGMLQAAQVLRDRQRVGFKTNEEIFQAIGDLANGLSSRAAKGGHGREWDQVNKQLTDFREADKQLRELAHNSTVALTAEQAKAKKLAARVQQLEEQITREFLEWSERNDAAIVRVRTQESRVARTAVIARLRIEAGKLRGTARHIAAGSLEDLADELQKELNGDGQIPVQ